MFDYTKNTEYEYLVLESDLNELLLEQMALESEFIRNSCGANIILEADANEVENKKNDKQKTLFERIKAFFERILEMFKERTNELLKRDKPFIDSLGNGEKFDNIEFGPLKIEMTPYWKGCDLNEMDVILTKIRSLIDINKMPSNGDVSTNSIISSNQELSKYISNDTTFNDGIQKYFKVKKDSIKPVLVQGDDFKKLCKDDFLKYVKDYHGEAIRKMQNNKNAIMNASNKIQNMIQNKQSKEAAAESFCVIENSLYIDTDLKYCINSNAVFEAETPNIDNNKKEDEKDHHEFINEEKDKKTGNDIVRKFKDSSDIELEYAKNILQINEIALTSAMTVAQNKYDLYIKTIREVINADKVNSKGRTDNKETSTDTNKTQNNEGKDLLLGNKKKESKK